MTRQSPGSIRFPASGRSRPDEDHLFFGREKEIDELLRRLRTHRFLLGRRHVGQRQVVARPLRPDSRRSTAA